MMYGMYLKRHKKSFVIYTVFLLFFIIMSMQKLIAFQADAAVANQLLDTLPNVVKVVYGLSELDVTSLDGYYAVLSLYYQIMLGMYAGILGARLIYEEEDLKTSEFIFVKPVSRTKVLVKKFIAALSLVLILNILIILIGYGYIYYEFNSLVTNYVDLALAEIIISIFFLAVGTFLSSLKHNKHATLILVGVVLLAFLIRVIGLIKEINLSFISILYAFDATAIIKNGISVEYCIYYILLTIILFGLSILSINKRDIRS